MKAKRALQIGNIFTYIFAIVLNILTGAQLLGGKSIKTISDTYATFLTPATYAFSIWGLIYLLLFGLVIYQARDLFKPSDKNTLPQKMGIWLMFSSVANGLWTLLFIHELILSSLLIIIALAASLYMLIYKLNIAREPNETKRIVFIWWPILFYTGWVSVAFLINVAAYVKYLGGEISAVTTIIVLSVVAVGLLALLVTRHVRELLVASAWGIAAIGVARASGELANTSVEITAFVIAIVLLIACGIHGYMHRNERPGKKI